MDSGPPEDASSFARSAAAYRAAALRDPRRFRFGYLAGDPASGARGAFVWFASPAEMFEFLATVEVDLLQFDDDDAARIRGSIRRIVGRPREALRVDRDRLSSSFEGWCEVLWLGSFADLCSRGGDVPTSVRIAFRRVGKLGEHAGPICDDEESAFVAFLCESLGEAGAAANG